MVLTNPHGMHDHHFNDHLLGDHLLGGGQREQLQNEMAGDIEQVGQQWTDRAMCIDKTELFFARPGEREGRRNRREAVARAYCACCPVQRMCLLAGRLGREHGMWGGENDEQRAAAGFGPKSPHRRAVAKAARESRAENGAPLCPSETAISIVTPLTPADRR